MTIDLHTHTRYSDGTDDADQWMAAACSAGLTTVAITDHDTTAGWNAAARARPESVTVVRGAELSTHITVAQHRYSIHLLAYLFDPGEPELADEMARLRADRRERGLRIVDAMAGDGLPVSREQVWAMADGAPVGRPHIARVLIEAGMVSSVGEAFTSYLSPRGPYYHAKTDTDLIHAITLVRRAGGVPVLAHPRSRGASRVTDESLIASLAGAGLAGVEVDHPDHDAADRTDLRDIARRQGLIATGSSDYHGANKTLVIGQEHSAPSALAALVSESSGATGLLGPG